MDNRILVFLLSLGAILLAATVGAMIGLEDMVIPCLVLVLASGIFFITTPRVASFAVVALFASGLTAPGLPGQMGLAQGAEAALIGIAGLLMVFGRASLNKISSTQILLIAFCLIVFITGISRGFGFRFLGSDLWGGTYYIDFFLCSLLVFALPRVNMPANWWPIAILAMGLLALARVLAEVLFVKTGASFITLFVQLDQASTSTELSDAATGEGVGRLLSAGTAVAFMVIAFLAIVHTSKLFKAKSVFSILVLFGLFALSLLSGFRLLTLMVAVTVTIAAIYQKTITIPRAVFAMITALVILGTIYYVSDSLPINVQRAVSWLPNIHVSAEARGDANQTVDWRLDVWRAAIQYIPEYFWIGKGFAFDGDLLISSKTAVGWDPISWALIQGAYHNGYLSLLLLLGVFGLIIGVALLVSVLVRLVKLNYAPWKSATLLRCYQAFLSSITGMVIVYLTVYGDVPAVFPTFLFLWAVLESIRACDEKLSAHVPIADGHTHILEEEYASLE